MGISYESIDINDDGRADILSAEAETPDGTPRPPGGMIWWEAPVDRVNGTWIKHTIDAGLQDVHNIRLGDMNNDGVMDIIFGEQDQSDQKRVGILYNVGGTGQNWQMQLLGTYGGHNQWVADDDGDGDLDILSSPHGYYSGFNPIDLFQNGLVQSGIARPVIASDPSTQTIPLGEAVDFSVSATANAAMAYQWLRNGVAIPGATSPLYHLAKVIPSDEGAVFECVVSDAAGFVKSAAATLHIDDPIEPVAWVNAPNLTLGGGATYQFSVSYADSVDILAATLGNGDLLVTGPSGYSQPATLLTTVYSIPAPTGAWKNGDNGTYTISLQGGQVIDSLSRYFPAQNLGTFAVTIAAMVTPALGGSQAAAASGYNLTTLGTSDWAHWGRGGVYGNFDHLFSSTSLISNITVVGAGANTGGSTLAARSVSWNNGAPWGTVNNDHGFIWNNGALSSGFSFTVPADTTTRTLYVYAGGTGAGTTLTAHLSDGSMPDFIAVASSSGAFTNLYTITYRAPAAGRTLTVTYLKTQNITGTTGSADLIAAALIAAPQPSLLITDASFSCDALPQSIAFTFNGTQPITAPASGVLSLLNLTTNDSINYAIPGVVAFDGITRKLTWAFPTALPDGNYRATLAAGALTDMTGNPLASTYSFDFAVLAGDANGDRKVDTYDLVIVATNWQGTGRTFSQGDFNHDGVVNSADLGILAAKWQQKLDPPPAASAPAPTTARRAPSRTPTRVAELIN